MSITSLPFILFTTAVVASYNLVSQNGRWVVLLVASYSFYASFGQPLLLATLFSVTLISFLTAQGIAGEGSARVRLRWLWSGIALNLTFLVGFKYFPFFVQQANYLLASSGTGYRFAATDMLVSIGVSYYVFQGISYITDVYLEQVVHERHFGRFALYLSFFPKLLQGPIERGDKLLPQLVRFLPTSPDNLRSGIYLFTWGMFKKVVVADRLAALVDPVYNNVTAHSGLSFIIATYIFAFQLYFDFSGYTDMALGVARCFNVELTQNFNVPYMARSIADFWRRWHISFSTWILDYIFKPLQFYLRRLPHLRTSLALVVTFLASGIWHGSSWCFIIWGLLHGCYLAFATLISKKKQKLYKYLGADKSRIMAVVEVVVTFHLVCLAWVFFRAARVSDALYILRHTLPELIRDLSGGTVALYCPPQELGRAITLIAGICLIGFIDRKVVGVWQNISLSYLMQKGPFYITSAIYGILCYMIILCGASTQSFIYLHF
jgi:D-alanyl-lipoteichoic acid acyltransferase DltB (MBOAT superfamily)